MLEFKAEEARKKTNIIELKGISQSYDGGKSFIIKDFNLEIEDKPMQGEFVVLRE